jgi:hypothetical protein
MRRVPLRQIAAFAPMLPQGVAVSERGDGFMLTAIALGAIVVAAGGVVAILFRRKQRTG